MSMSDPIADMLTRIRNGQAAEKVSVRMPSSKAKVAIAAVLKDEGYISDFSVDPSGGNEMPSGRNRQRATYRPVNNRYWVLGLQPSARAKSPDEPSDQATATEWRCRHCPRPCACRTSNRSAVGHQGLNIHTSLRPSRS